MKDMYMWAGTAAVLAAAGALASCGGGGGNPVGAPPIARATTSAAFGLAPLAVDFDAAGSSDPDGGNLDFFWDIDDDNVPESRTAQVSATFTTPGEHTVLLQVKDIQGLTDTEEVTVTVTESEPPGLSPAAQTLFTAGPGLTAGAVSATRISGNPAVAFIEGGGATVRFMRAADSVGTAWPRSSAIGSVGILTGCAVALAEVDGIPAVAWYDPHAGTLFYRRAIDAAGSGWGATVTVDSDGDAGRDVHLLTAGGRPLLVYTAQPSFSLEPLVLLRQGQDAQGSAWGNATIVTPPGMRPDLLAAAVVQGSPAVAVYDDDAEAITYIRASDETGESWGTLVPVDFGDGRAGMALDLDVLDGRPAIAVGSFAFSQPDNFDLVVSLASDPLGSFWGEPLPVETGAQSTGNIAIDLADMDNGVTFVAHDRAGQLAVSERSGPGDSFSPLPSLQNTLVSDVSLVERVGVLNAGLAYWDFTNGRLKLLSF